MRLDFSWSNLNFKYKLTRANFEKMAAEHVARIGTPVEQALTAAGLQLSDTSSALTLVLIFLEEPAKFSNCFWTNGVRMAPP
jgi:hypothetical protein